LEWLRVFGLGFHLRPQRGDWGTGPRGHRGQHRGGLEFWIQG